MKPAILGSRKDDLLEDALSDSFFSNLCKKEENKSIDELVGGRIISASHQLHAYGQLESKFISYPGISYDLSKVLVLAPQAYRIDCDIEIPNDFAIQIFQGTTLYFSENAGFVNDGHLFITGTNVEGANLTAYDPDKGWRGIHNKGVLRIDYACLSHGSGRIMSHGHVGGFIHNEGEAHVFMSEFNLGHAGRGGAIYNHGKLTVDKSQFCKNKAVNGGGIFQNHGELSVSRDTEFTENVPDGIFSFNEDECR